jgi:hypothetical protein
VVPRLGELAERLGVGPACKAGTAQVFAVEEEQTRLGGARQEVAMPLPRVVIGGCGQDESGAAEGSSFGLFLVGVSDAERGTTGDPLATTPAELMALDRQTGRYNFYEVQQGSKEGWPRISRLVPDGDGSGTRISLDTGDGTWQKTPSGQCFGCHRNAMPLLNERTDPWHRWISPRKAKFERNYEGETERLLAWTLGKKEWGHAPSHASALEALVLAGARHAAVHQVKSHEPRERARLLRALLCENEVEFFTEIADLPLDLFLDPVAIAGAFPAAPKLVPGVPVVQVPGRSFSDRSLAQALVEQGIISKRVALASRVLDDENDIFSVLRCGILEDLAGVPWEGLDGALRSAVKKRRQDGMGFPARDVFLEVLLEEDFDEKGLATYRHGYFIEVNARLKEISQRLKTAEGKAWLKEQIQTRKAGAIAMFPPPSSPLPVWTD